MSKAEPRRINLVPLGFIYFGLFSISIYVDMEKRLFLFPLLGPKFLTIMAVDFLVAVGAALLVVGVTALGVKISRHFRELVSEFRALIGPLQLKEVFFIAAFSAVGEEFFFRGFLQAELGLVVASLAFGLLHVGPSRRFLPWTLFAIVVGFFLGWLYMWRGNLLVPVVAHFGINFINLVEIGRTEQAQRDESS